MEVKHEVPILRTTMETSYFMAEIIRLLHVELAPSISVHGVLVDVYGEGVLIMGDSGIGKSDAALELINRGHRLIADDIVDIKKVSDGTLVGQAPDILENLIELRGIGNLDVKIPYGVESVKKTQRIDLVIQLNEWKKIEVENGCLEDEYIDFLGNKVALHTISMRPERNLAIICETAAVNYREKKFNLISNRYY